MKIMVYEVRADERAELERQSRDGMLPDLPEGMAAQLIQASDTGKLYTLEPDVYIYEVPCRLQYIQEA